MSDELILLLLWSAAAAHAVIAVGSVTGRMTFTCIPACNAVVGGGIVIYWIGKWYSYLFEGIRWYLSDQWIPAYGAFVVLICAAYAVGRRPPAWLHRALFYLHTFVLLAAAVFFSTFELDRLF